MPIYQTQDGKYEVRNGTQVIYRGALADAKEYAKMIGTSMEVIPTTGMTPTPTAITTPLQLTYPIAPGEKPGTGKLITLYSPDGKQTEVVSAGSTRMSNLTFGQGWSEMPPMGVAITSPQMPQGGAVSSVTEAITPKYQILDIASMAKYDELAKQQGKPVGSFYERLPSGVVVLNSGVTPIPGTTKPYAEVSATPNVNIGKRDFYKAADGSYYFVDNNEKILNLNDLNKAAQAGGKEVSSPGGIEKPENPIIKAIADEVAKEPIYVGKGWTDVMATAAKAAAEKMFGPYYQRQFENEEYKLKTDLAQQETALARVTSTEKINEKTLQSNYDTALQNARRDYAASGLTYSTERGNKENLLSKNLTEGIANEQKALELNTEDIRNREKARLAQAETTLGTTGIQPYIGNTGYTSTPTNIATPYQGDITREKLLNIDLEQKRRKEEELTNQLRLEQAGLKV